jgi:CCR4-NOT transcription complex subunit 3
MEKFKAVEKEMKTKAYSKEGLQAAAKLDPKEREKAEACDFLSKMVEDLERQVEQIETETEVLGASTKKGKKADAQKAERIGELERMTERHKWHQSRLELMLRSLENGVLEVDQVRDLEEEIRYYVENNSEVDFIENDTMYDELDLQEEEDLFGMPADGDRQSSLDAQSLADDQAETAPLAKQKSTSASEPSTAAVRRPSIQLKSPLPALATLHTPGPVAANGPVISNPKPAPPPTRTPGEPLKYASAAAAAAASDKNGLGLTSFPPPVRELGQPLGLSPIPATVKAVAAASPAGSAVQPIPQQIKATVPAAESPVPSSVKLSGVSAPKPDRKKTPAPEEEKRAVETDKTTEEILPPSTPSLTNGDTHSEAEEEESVWHLPSSLSDLIESFDAAKSSAFQPLSMPSAQHVFSISGKSFPETVDSERPQHYRPTNPYPYTPHHYPQEPAHIFETPELYGRCETETLFYSFYYKQGTYQQYAAAKALKAASWRFHKQYQTWFQRHEEPKDITEDYEQGTYRFFDYESTW